MQEIKLHIFYVRIAECAEHEEDPDVLKGNFIFRERELSNFLQRVKSGSFGGRHVQEGCIYRGGGGGGVSNFISHVLAPLCHLAAELFKCRLVRRWRRRQL